jgi:hypothetical protein
MVCSSARRVCRVQEACLYLNPRLLLLPQVHSGAFVDMAWTPDGYTLIAAAGDDKVSVMRCVPFYLPALRPAELHSYVSRGAEPSCLVCRGLDNVLISLSFGHACERRPELIPLELLARQCRLLNPGKHASLYMKTVSTNHSSCMVFCCACAGSVCRRWARH